jgi:hypothetical protein
MRTTNFFYYMLFILALMGMMYCGSGNNTDNANGADSSEVKSDSAMSAHNRDPSTAYPEPPVTGSSQDSSRTKDSANKQPK